MTVQEARKVDIRPFIDVTQHIRCFDPWCRSYLHYRRGRLHCPSCRRFFHPVDYFVMIEGLNIDEAVARIEAGP